MSYKEFKADYTRIQNLSKIEEMLEVIGCQEEALMWFKAIIDIKKNK